ncbi:MAG TPA: hypothetical protein VGP62_00785 [Bryobacteraceae bacterium]|jgi:hypothetical protein|nr:hypothetical protein [Bryobacteraceae bacterium]
MRSLVPIALLGSFVLVTAQAQSLAEHAAAASGATIGTAAGKPLSNAITKIFGQTDTAAKKAATAPAVTNTPAKPEPESAPLIQAVPQSGGAGELPSIGGGSAPSRHGGFAPRRADTELASINPPEPVPAYQEPPRKEPTDEDFATIQVGASEEQVVAALGQPESKVTIPDDGHLVQICQYWSNGKQIGTVRLDNGQVVTVESRARN